jgi:anti-sigma B factor antagonist
MPQGSPRTRAATSSRSKIAVVRLPVEIDVTNDDAVHALLTQALRAGTPVVIGDASETVFCGCAGVDALASAHHEAVAAGAQLRIVASPAVQRILELTHADQVFSVYPTVAEALGPAEA